MFGSHKFSCWSLLLLSATVLDDTCICTHIIYFYFVYSGLPVPIVAIAAGIAHKNYGSENV